MIRPAPTATASPAPNALANSVVSGSPLARPDCLAQRGHFWPTAVVTMQRVQIGSPQLEQVSLVSTFGWLTHVGARFFWSVAIVGPSTCQRTRCAPARWVG